MPSSGVPCLFCCALFGFYLALQPGRAWAFENSASIGVAGRWAWRGSTCGVDHRVALGCGAAICRREGDNTYAGTEGSSRTRQPWGRRPFRRTWTETVVPDSPAVDRSRPRAPPGSTGSSTSAIPKPAGPTCASSRAGWEWPVDLDCSSAQPDDACRRALQAGDCSVETSSIKHCTLSVRQRMAMGR